MMSLQLDTRAHCDVNSVQGAGGTRTLSNGGTWRSSATLIAARHRVGILSDSRSSVARSSWKPSFVGLRVTPKLRLARHADLVGRHDGEPCAQRGVEEPRARAGPALFLVELVLTYGASKGRQHRGTVEPGLGFGRELLLETRLLHDLLVCAAHIVDWCGVHGRASLCAGDAGSVHEAPYGDERLDIARAGVV